MCGRERGLFVTSPRIELSAAKLMWESYSRGDWGKFKAQDNQIISQNACTNADSHFCEWVLPSNILLDDPAIPIIALNCSGFMDHPTNCLKWLFDASNSQFSQR